MRFLQITIFSLFMSSTSYGQIGGDFDIDACVVLGDGSSILGQLIHRDRHSVTLLLSIGDTLEIEYGYIKRFRGGSDRMEIHQKGNFHYKSGDYFDLSLGFAVSGFLASSHTHFRAARRLTHQKSLGFGLGLDTYEGDFTNDSYSYLSIYTYGRYYLKTSRKKRTRPFLAGALGYGFAENLVDQWTIQQGVYQGGVMAKPSIGLHFASKSKLKTMVSLTWHIQNTRAQYNTPEWWWGPTVSSVTEKIWFMRTGLSFTFEYN